MPRPSADEYFLNIAQVVSTRGTCARRRVGAVLVDDKKHILATGYNGPASGRPHCIDHPCAGVSYASGMGLDTCEAIHAEANALLQCKDAQGIHTTYCTLSPCIHCVKLLMNTSCKRIVFSELYTSEHTEIAWRLWVNDGIRGRTPFREWIYYGSGQEVYTQRESDPSIHTGKSMESKATK